MKLACSWTKMQVEFEDG